MTQVDTLWIILAALHVLLLQAGFLCLEAGTVRAKNAGNVALKNLTDLCVVSLSFWALGYGVMFGTSHLGLFGTDMFLLDLSDGVGHLAALFVFQMAFVSTASTIISGAVAERESYLGYIVLSAATAALVYPIVGHLIWNEGGWLAQIGFIDFAGATVVHSVGGWAALMAVVVIGPRLGRYGHKKRRFEESSVAMTALGALLLWVGWGAFNGGSALAFGEEVAPIVARTMLTAAAGGISAIICSVWGYGYVRVDLPINGVLAGLVAGTAGIHLMDAPQACLVGSLGGIVMFLSQIALDRLHIDDVVAAIPVHLFAGIAGTLSVAWIAPHDLLVGGSRLLQLGVQLLGVAIVGIWCCSIVGVIALSLNARGVLRASRRDEVLGLNLSQNHQRTAFSDLLRDMQEHRTSGSFSKRARVETGTDVGVVARRYNQVLDRVQREIEIRMSAIAKEKQVRQMAEEAFEAMRHAQKEGAWAARHDKLTGLGNRLLLEEIAGDAHALGSTETLAIAIDLDRFKEINDTYGHEAGDTVLANAANQIRKHMEEGRDFGFRVGGDEFALLVGFDGTLNHADEFCNDLLFDLLQPVMYKGTELRVGGSIGYAMARADEKLSETLHRADLALYASKEAGRGCVTRYSSGIEAEYTRKMELVRDFKMAFEREEISILLQPQVDAHTHELRGCEALARWNHPERGVLTPDQFLHVAEEAGLLAELDKQVLDLALEAQRHLNDLGVALPEISVNVSAKRLTQPGLIEELRKRRDLPENGLAFEILETAFLDTVTEQTDEILKSLRDLGIRLEVDDFGTGHASLASVLALQPDRVKIDRMFADKIDQMPERRKLMQGLIEIANNVGAKTVVEGVETKREAEVLSELMADVLQGFYFARPMTLDDLSTWALRRETSAREVG